MRKGYRTALVHACVVACLVAPLAAARPLEVVMPPQGSLRAGLQGVRHLIPLEGFGANPNAAYRPLKVCQGDCDKDDDCQGSLVCFQRKPGDPVPGCEGGEEAMSKTDFCVESTHGDNGQGQQQESPTEDEDTQQNNAPEGRSVPVEKNASVEKTSSEQKEENESGLPSIVGYGSSPDNVLKECEGDCDDDSECQGGLVCFQRDVGQAVPGCQGVALSKSDFCVKSIYAASDRTDVSGGNSEYVFSLGSDGELSSSSALAEDTESDEGDSDSLLFKLIIASAITGAVLLAICLTCICYRRRQANQKGFFD